MNTENKGVVDQDPQTSQEETFQRDIAFDRADYRLPYRDTRELHMTMIWSILGSIGGIAFMCFWMWMPLSSGIDLLKQNQPFGWAMVAFASLGLMGLIPAIGMLCVSIGVLLNRSYCSIAVTTRHLICTDRAFIVRRRRKINVDQIRRLMVSDDFSDIRPKQPTMSNKPPIGLLMVFGALDHHLIAETDKDGMFCIALGYPKEMLMKLAEDLAPRINSEAPSIRTPIQRSASSLTNNISSSTGNPTTGVQIVDSDQVKVESDQTRTIAPEGTNIEVTRRDDGLTIEVPARKDWQGAKFVKIFATLWNAFSWFMFFALLSDFRNNGFSFLFLLPFVGVGVVLLLIIRHQSTCRTTIATADDMLFLQTKSQLRQRRQEWHCEQIQRICVDDSGTEYNDESLQELQIHVLGEKKFGCLAQLSIDEMNWVSALLNDDLALPEFDRHQYPFRDELDRPIAHTGSPASVRYTNDEAIITLPGKSLASTIALIFVGLLFLVIGLTVFAAVYTSDNFADAAIFITVWTIGFAGGGLAMMVSAYAHYKSRFEITVSKDKLDIHRWGILRRKHFEFTKDEVGKLKVDDSGWKVNEQQQVKLFIGSDHSKRVKIAQSRPEVDLKMVATVINETMV